jgi:magnesium chelatase subunit I
VSVRVSIANYENLVSNALRRAIRTGEKEAVPRVSDLPALIPSSAGKLELETWEENDDSSVLEKIIRTACSNVFRRHFTVQEFSDLVQRFDRGGFTVEVSDHTPSDVYETAIRELPGIDKAAAKLEEPSSPATRAAVLEFILEGLHLSKRLNKTPIDGSTIYGG